MTAMTSSTPSDLGFAPLLFTSLSASSWTFASNVTATPAAGQEEKAGGLDPDADLELDLETTSGGTAAAVPWTRVVLGVALYVLVAVTVAGNVLTVAVVVRERRLQTVFNVFIVNLAVTDTLVGLVAMNFFALYNVLQAWPFGQFLCGLWIYGDFGMTFVSIFTLLTISIDRYWSVRWSNHYRIHNTRRKAALATLSIWGMMLLLWTPAFAVDRINNSRPGECFYDPEKNKSFVIAVAVVGYHGTTIVMLFCYINVYLFVKSRSKVGIFRKRHTPSEATETAFSTNQAFRSSDVEEDNDDDVTNGATPTAAAAAAATRTRENGVAWRAQNRAKTNKNRVLLVQSATSNFLSPNFLPAQNDLFRKSPGTRSSSNNISSSNNGTARTAIQTVSSSVSVTGGAGGTSAAGYDVTELQLVDVSDADGLSSPTASAAAHPAAGARSGAATESATTACATVEEATRPRVREPGAGGGDTALPRTARFEAEPPTGADAAETTHSRASLRALRREQKVFLTLSYVMLGYLVCWLPFHVAFDLMAIDRTLVPERFYDVTYWLAYVNSTINPLLYHLSSPDFHRAFRKILGRK